jgi:hypothetical protein
MREIHCNQELLPQSLAAAGIRPAEVDVVINTHRTSIIAAGTQHSIRTVR